jgi:CheY-like chemotaxis protein
MFGAMIERRARRVTKPFRVLIIEDNDDGRKTLQALLRLLGYEVEAAANGIEGIERAIAWEPDIALIDIGLPGKDGYQVARALRSVFGDDIVLIAHTGYGTPDDRERAMHAGFNAHMTKPVDWLELHYWLASSLTEEMPP